MSRLVGYRVVNLTPDESGQAYTYWLCGDGVWLWAENPHLVASINTAPCLVRGLPPGQNMLTLKHGRIPGRFWDLALSVFFAHPETECFIAVTWQDGAYHMVKPEQVGEAASIHFTPVPDTVLELHSHPNMAAGFSSIDDADEQGLKLYGVVGWKQRRPTEVELRLGAYGYFQPVKWSDVFDGELWGAFEKEVE